MRISDWSSDVCSSDLRRAPHVVARGKGLIGIETRGVAGGRGLKGLPGIDSVERRFAVLGAVNAVGDVPAAEHRYRALDDPHVHLAKDLGKRAAVTAAKKSEEHTSELQSLMRISYAVFCLKKKTLNKTT